MMGALRHAATQAQARARLPGLLALPTWQALLEQGDVAGIAARLQDSAYGGELPTEPAALERRLTAVLAEETHVAATFTWGALRALLVAYGRRFELANVKTVLRARHHGIPWERCAVVMIPLPRSTVPWRTLLEAPTTEAVARLLEGTPFARPLTTVLEQQGDATPFRFEVALDLAYFQDLVRRIERLSGRDGQRARTFLGGWIEVENLSWAFRYRRLAGLTPEETVNYTLHRAFGAGLEAVRRVVTGASVTDEAARLGYAVDADAPEDEALAALERAAGQARTEAAERVFQGAPFDLGAPLALLTLRETDVHDLVTLIAGVTAGLARTAMATRFVGPARELGA
ncbi:MAG: V-type ATPase subunit [Deinococcales bacterium]